MLLNILVYNFRPVPRSDDCGLGINYNRERVGDERSLPGLAWTSTARLDQKNLLRLARQIRLPGKGDRNYQSLSNCPMFSSNVCTR